MGNGKMVEIESKALFLIPPTEREDFKQFCELGEEHKFDKLHEWGLISKTAQQNKELKEFVYVPHGSHGPFNCEVVGYIPWEHSKNGKVSIVIEIAGHYTKIHPAFLKEMQGGSSQTSQVKKDIVVKDRTGLPTDYIVYDIETTGINCEKDAIIEIAAIKVSKNEIVDRFESLIALPSHITPDMDIASHIHGITFDMLKDAPEASEILKKFLDFIGDFTLVGHNIATFDNVMVQKALDKYLEVSFNNNYIDTLLLSRRYFNNLPTRTLDAMAQHFNIPYVNAHRAISDCEINNQVFLGIRDYMKKNGFKYTEKKKSYGVQFRPEEITTHKKDFDPTHFLFQMNCALSDIKLKKEVAQIIKDAGGEPQNSVTRKTNVLVHGDGATTGKVKKAMEYNEKYNQGIMILCESEFRKIIAELEQSV